MYIMGKEEIDAVARVIQSGHLFRYRDGFETETDQLEKELAAKMGATHALAMSSGTASLICGLAGMGIGPSDEVIVPAYTFMATALAPLAVGAVPVLAEIDDSLTISPEDIERKITPRTRAIIPVHMVGLPCNMDAIMAIAQRHGIQVLEDACQADGGSYRGRRLGTIGQAGAYSFNHFKIISAGESGALVTSDREIYERARVQHDGGCVFFSEEARRQSVQFFAGVNFRISEVLSAIVRVQLGRLDTILSALRTEKRAIAEAIDTGAGVRLPPVNDAAGDCGVVLALQFGDNARARAFIAACARRDIVATTPIDSGRHVYTNWEPIMRRRGAHVDTRNPLAGMPTVDTPEDVCPDTLAILARTVYLSPSATRSVGEREAAIGEIRAAIAEAT